MRNHLRFCVFAVFLFHTVHAQNTRPDTSQTYSLNQCIRYALQAQPTVKQAAIDEAITRTNNRIALSAGLPQVNLNTALNHYMDLPTTFIPNTQSPASDKVQTRTGLYNTILPNFTASQVLLSNDVLAALRTSPIYNRQAKQNTEAKKIDVVVNVSLAYYDVLLSQAQIVVLAEDTARLGRNLRDAYNQYIAGIVDKVDYKRATIALNNSVADLKNAGESIDAKTSVLKREMGYPPNDGLLLTADTVQMMSGISMDTMENLQFRNRIEYQLLNTNRQLQHQTTVYYATGFLPSISAFYSYVPEFENDRFSTLFNNIYPYSLFGINLSLPIFQGFRRIENVRKSRLQEDRLYWDEANLQSQINAEFRNAMAAYRSNLNSYASMKSNVQLAREVYDVIRLQYREGIKQYLEVITAESDLRSSEINYLNALYQLLESKVSLQRAMGDIHSDI